MLWCEKAVTGGKQIQQAHPALEGSPCGSGKVNPKVYNMIKRYLSWWMGGYL